MPSEKILSFSVRIGVITGLAVYLPELEDRNLFIINVASFSVFHTEATVSIGLRNALRMVTSFLQN